MEERHGTKVLHKAENTKHELGTELSWHAVEQLFSNVSAGRLSD